QRSAPMTVHLLSQRGNFAISAAISGLRLIPAGRGGFARLYAPPPTAVVVGRTRGGQVVACFTILAAAVCAQIGAVVQRNTHAQEQPLIVSSAKITIRAQICGNALADVRRIAQGTNVRRLIPRQRVTNVARRDG